MVRPVSNKPPSQPGAHSWVVGTKGKGHRKDSVIGGIARRSMPTPPSPKRDHVANTTLKDTLRKEAQRTNQTVIPYLGASHRVRPA